jgi:hypothetical protein
MLNLLDELLRKILMDGVNRLTSVPEQIPGRPAPNPPVPPKPPLVATQIGFGPPDDKWVTDVKTSQLNSLNVYLVDLRENRKLRSNERERSFDNGVAYETPVPMRLDCHYLISAWSPTEYLTPLVEPVLDEHLLLYQSAAALAHAVPFNPSRVYPAGSPPLDPWTQLGLQNVDLPAVVAPAEGFPKLAEFWGTMGQGHRWKPMLYLVVTVPVKLITEVAGYMVTTRITEYRQWGKPETAEVWIQIGGSVLDTSHPLANGDPAPITDAWVQLETTKDVKLQTTETDKAGRFTFSNLRPGQYQLHVRAIGKDKRAPIEVPSPTGEYDVRLP